MAERRMFALKIIDSDAFLDMPDSAQNLYFHLAMRADDDGFISNPKKVMRMIRASEDNLKILLAKRFLLSFDTGIVVIKHWRLHNYIAKDRYTETIYKEEKEKLFVKANGAYTDHPEPVLIPYTDCTQNDDVGKVRLGKDSIDKDREEAPANPSPLHQKRFVKPKLEEVSAYCQERHNTVDPQNFLDFYESKGWRVGNTPMKDWRAAVRTWERREAGQNSARASPFENPYDELAREFLAEEEAKKWKRLRM
jgi:hypothetical protein